MRTFLAATARAGGADKLRWRVVANQNGKVNRVTYRRDDAPTPGWYAYLRQPSNEPRDVTFAVPHV